MRRKSIGTFLRLAAALGICFLAWTRAPHSIAHADIAGDPHGSFSGEGPDNFWDIGYNHCRDGVIVNVQQLKHIGETVSDSGVLSTDSRAYSINLRSVEVQTSVGTSDLALTTQVPVAKVGTQFPSDILLPDRQQPTDYSVYKLTGAKDNTGQPLSATVVFQHAPQAVGVSGTTTFERWDHGVLGLAPNGQDDDFDAGGVIDSLTEPDGDDTNGGTDTGPSGDTDGDVADEDGNAGEDGGDGSQHDDSFSFTTQITDCSVLPTTAATLTPAANANGWNTAPVDVHFSASDTILTQTDPSQGVKQINVQAQRADGTESTGGTLPPSGGSLTLPSDGTWTVTYDATDTLGNTEAQKTLTVYVDSVAPNLTISGPADGAVASICTVSTPTFTASDPNLADGSAGSGVASSSDHLTTPSTASGGGTYTYMATATDRAGNSTSATRTYQVHYPFTGPLSPFSNSTTTANMGSTVPVKFQSLCGTTPITNIVAKLYVQKVSPPAGPLIRAVSSTSSPGNVFTYDPKMGQYIFNLSTKGTGMTKGTWFVVITLDDGTTYSATLNLT